MTKLISLGQLLDTSLELYKKYWREFLGISLWLVAAFIPGLVGSLLVPLGNNQGGLADWLSFSFSIAGAIIVAVVSAWIIISVILIASTRTKGQTPDLSAISKKSWQLFLPYVMASIIVLGIILGLALLPVPGLALMIFTQTQTQPSFFLLALGALLFFVGGIAATVFLIKLTIELGFVPYALALDNARGIQTVKQSIALVKGRWWATFFRFVIPKLIYMFVIVLINFIVPAALSLLAVLAAPNSTILTKIIFVVAYLFTVTVSAASTPLIVVTDFVLYDSLRKTRG